MKISTEQILKLNPCQDRKENYLNYYKDFEGDIEDFVMLEHLTFKDKVWVVTKLFTKEQNVRFSLLCASSVLSHFESMFPDDLRPRKALEAAEAWLLKPCEETRSAAWSARSAAARSAWSAAESAADAAWSAAWSARSAAESAADAAWSAESAARSAEINLIFMVDVARLGSEA